MHQVVMVTVPSAEVAQSLSRTLVQERLCACVNIVPGLTSVYWWQGEVQQDQELLLLIKTTAAKHAALQQRILELHPYDTPEVVALPIEQGSAAYLKWISDSLEPDLS